MRNLNALIVHIEQPDRSARPGPDVPMDHEGFAEAGMPAWAMHITDMPEPWRSRFAAISNDGPAECALQARFLRMLNAVPRGQRSDKANMPLD